MNAHPVTGTSSQITRIGTRGRWPTATRRSVVTAHPVNTSDEIDMPFDQSGSGTSWEADTKARPENGFTNARVHRARSSGPPKRAYTGPTVVAQATARRSATGAQSRHPSARGFLIRA